MKTNQTTIYHPKGSMCATCVHKDRDCSNLKFHSMHVLEQYSYEVLQQYSYEKEPLVFKVVLCEEFVR